MDHLRQGIHLRAYAQKQPKQEYKRESFHLFQNLLQNVQHESIRMLTRMDIKPDTVIRKPDRESTLQTRKEFNPMLKARSSGTDGQRAEIKQPYVREQRKVGRNEPCTCGSGKKFKHCCGAIRSTA